MATTTNFSLLFIFFLSVSIRVQGSGFSVNLIHRDSPQSPFYNPLDTLSDRMQKAVNRSTNRANYFKKLSSSTYSANHDETIITSLSVIDYEFVMNISIGTPPHNVFAIADTGSMITWVQCEPCEVCYPQISPLFKPKTSSSYKDFPCVPGCHSCENNICQYFISYGDHSHSEGNLAFETVAFDSTGGRPIQLPNIAFGCAHGNDGQALNKKVSGLVGLSGGELSLISQLGSKIDSKFSYCLVPPSDNDFSSRFTFGSNAEIIGEGVVSTPLVSNPLHKTHYYLTLEGISVNGNRVPFKSNSSSTKDIQGFQEDNHIMIDSGTTLTYLPEEMYLKLQSEFEKAMDAEPIAGPKIFNLCYQLDESMKYPDVIVHFTDADIKLEPKNYIAPVDGSAVCLIFVPTGGTSYIYGNIVQINFLVEYDLKEKKVSFKPTDCSKQG